MSSPGGVDVGDLATLGLKVDGTQLKSGGRDAKVTLEEIAASGEKAERSVEKLGASQDKLARIYRSAGERIRREQQRTAGAIEAASRDQGRAQAQAMVEGLEREFQLSLAVIKEQQARGFITPAEARVAGAEAAQAYNAGLIRTLDQNQITGGRNAAAFTKIAGSLKNVTETSRSAGVGIGRLGESVVSLTRQVTGVNPAVAQLSYVLGGMQIGAPLMIGVLGGLAAAALALRAITADARDARKELEKQLDVLRDIAEQREITARGGPTAVAIDAGKEEAKRLAVLLQQAIGLDNQALVESLRKQLMEQNTLVREGLAEREDEEARSNERQLREAEQAAKKRLDALRAENKERIAEMARANTEMIERAAAAMEDAFKSEGEKLKELATALNAAIEASARPRLGVDQVVTGGVSPQALEDVDHIIDAWARAPRSIEASAQAWADIQERLRLAGGDTEDLLDGQKRYMEMMVLTAEAAEKLADQMREVRDVARVIRRMVGGPLGALAGGVFNSAGRAFNGPGPNNGDLLGSAQAGISVNQIGIGIAVGEEVVRRTARIFFGGRSERDRERELAENNKALERAAKSMDDLADRLAGFSSGQVGDFRETLAFLQGRPGGISSDTLRQTGGFFGVDTSMPFDIERLAKLIEDALAEAFKQVQERVVPDLFAREAELQGNAGEAARIRREAAAAAELRSIQDLADAGFITADQMERFARVIDGELVQAMEDARREAQRLTESLTADLVARSFEVTGNTGAAARIRLAQRQTQERRDAAGQSPEFFALMDLVQQGERSQLAFETQTQAIQDAANDQVAAIDRQSQIARDQLFKAEESLRAQEQAVETSRRIVESLTQFGDSLKLGSFSPLSPFARLSEARSQFGALSGLALGGDASAAESLPGAARALLDASRGFNASGGGFVADFQRVQDTVRDVRDRFGTQLTTDERILAELQSQTSKLLDQIARLDSQRSAILTSAERQIAELKAAHEAEMEILRAQLDMARQIKLGNDAIHRDLGDRKRPKDPPTPPPPPPPPPKDDPVVVKAVQESNAHLQATVRTLQAGFEELLEENRALRGAVGDVSREVRRTAEVPV
jgi:hypothetical protein